MFSGDIYIFLFTEIGKQYKILHFWEESKLVSSLLLISLWWNIDFHDIPSDLNRHQGPGQPSTQQGESNPLAT